MTTITLVVDGMNILHRGYYATPPMQNSAGLPTNAIRGFVNILMSDLRRVKATHCAVVFDRPGKNFRHRLYPEYKAHRPKLDSVGMRQLVNPTRQLLQEMGIAVYGKKGIEGDDLIGSLAVNMSQHGRVYIDSNDKDFAALVNKRIHLLKPKGILMDAKGVFESYGVHPKQMVDYLMMLGDTVDNVPGINKVGPKTASKLLGQHGTLETVCRDAKLSVKMKENFDRAHKLFPLTRKLITLVTSHLQHVTPEHLELRGAQPGLKAVCDELEFKSTYKQIITLLR